MIGIYAIISPTGRVYIGQSINIVSRFSNYTKLESSVIGQTKLYRSLLKHGVDAHHFNVVEECEVEDLTEREGHWQDFFDCVRNGLNCFRVKTSDKSGYMSEETKKRVSEGRKGKGTGKNHHTWGKINVGRPHTEATKLIMKGVQTGSDNSFAKKVKHVITNEVWGCIKEAAVANNISVSTLYKKLNPLHVRKNNTDLVYI